MKTHANLNRMSFLKSIKTDYSKNITVAISIGLTVFVLICLNYLTLGKKGESVMSKGEETYQKIIDVSIYFFAKEGIHKTSFSKIAEALKMTKPSLYYYVKSKEELIHKVFDYIFDDYSFQSYFEKEELTKNTIEQYLISGGYQFIEEIEEQNILLNLIDDYILYARRMEENDTTYMEKIKISQQSFINGFVQILQQAEELNLIKEEYIVLRAQTLALMLDNIKAYHGLNMTIDSKQLWSYTVKQIFLSE